MVNVPSQYQPLVQGISQSTGVPYNVVAVQAEHESSFNATAVSSAGAEGWLQFEPATYDAYAAAAGVQPGTEFNPSDEAKVYVQYMDHLLKVEKGDLRNALAAYNAGEGNVSAGLGYADSILREAGQSDSTVTSTTGIHIPGIGTIPTSPGDFIQPIIDDILKMLGLGSLKDLFQRLGIILLGVALVLLGIHLMASGRKQPINVNVQESTGPGGEKTRTRKVNTPVGTHTKTTKTTGAAKATGERTGAASAVEAAAVA